jgi:hypothetical protein
MKIQYNTDRPENSKNCIVTDLYSNFPLNTEFRQRYSKHYEDYAEKVGADFFDVAVDYINSESIEGYTSIGGGSRFEKSDEPLSIARVEMRKEWVRAYRPFIHMWVSGHSHHVFAKFSAIDIAFKKGYEKVIWLDGDVLINPRARNLFDYMPKNTITSVGIGNIVVRKDYIKEEFNKDGIFGKKDSDIYNTNGGMYTFDSETWCKIRPLLIKPSDYLKCIKKGINRDPLPCHDEGIIAIVAKMCDVDIALNEVQNDFQHWLGFDNESFISFQVAFREWYKKKSLKPINREKEILEYLKEKYPWDDIATEPYGKKYSKNFFFVLQWFLEQDEETQFSLFKDRYFVGNMNHQDSVIDVPVYKLKKLRYVWDENLCTWTPGENLKVDSIKIENKNINLIMDSTVTDTESIEEVSIGDFIKEYSIKEIKQIDIDTGTGVSDFKLIHDLYDYQKLDDSLKVHGIVLYNYNTRFTQEQSDQIIEKYESLELSYKVFKKGNNLEIKLLPPNVYNTNLIITNCFPGNSYKKGFINDWHQEFIDYAEKVDAHFWDMSWVAFHGDDDDRVWQIDYNYLDRKYKPPSKFKEQFVEKAEKWLDAFRPYFNTCPGTSMYMYWKYCILKFACMDYAFELGYENVLWLDSDTFINPDAENIFDVFERDAVTVATEWKPDVQFVNCNWYRYVDCFSEKAHKEIENIEDATMCNNGIIMVSKDTWSKIRPDLFNPSNMLSYLSEEESNRYIFMKDNDESYISLVCLKNKIRRIPYEHCLDFLHVAGSDEAPPVIWEYFEKYENKCEVEVRGDIFYTIDECIDFKAMGERGWKIDPDTGMCSVSKGYFFYTLLYWFIHLPVEDRKNIWKLYTDNHIPKWI